VPCRVTRMTAVDHRLGEHGAGSSMNSMVIDTSGAERPKFR
jgi:hypothetical protein